MRKLSTLTYCGFNFDSEGDWSRKGMELSLQQRNQGLRPSIDYLFQPMMNGFQLSGISRAGARAVSILAQAHRITPNRLDITMSLEDTGVKDGTDFNSIVHTLILWFKMNKPAINISEQLPISGDRRILFGSRNSRWCLWVAERTDPIDVLNRETIEITWTTRNTNCVAAWEFFVSCGNDYDFARMSEEAFSACTNSLLGKDFFELGLSKLSYLRKDKPGSEQKDWHTYLRAVARKIAIHMVNDDNSDIDRDIAYLKQEIGRAVDTRLQV